LTAEPAKPAAKRRRRRNSAGSASNNSTGNSKKRSPANNFSLPSQVHHIHTYANSKPRFGMYIAYYHTTFTMVAVYIIYIVDIHNMLSFNINI